MIDRTTFDLRIAEHGTTTAHINQVDWQRQDMAGDAAMTNRTRRGGRPTLRAKLATAALILGCAAALTLGGVQATSEALGQVTAASAYQTEQAAFLPALSMNERTGPADEYTQAEGVTGPGPLVGTDDLATNSCIGTVGPFACQLGQSLTGTDDFALIGCVQVSGPFGCASAASGTNDLATNGCVGTSGLLACPSGSYRLSAPNEAEPDGSVVVATPATQPVDASTSEQFRWAFGATSSMTPDLAMLPPHLQNISI